MADLAGPGASRLGCGLSAVGARWLLPVGSRTKAARSARQKKLSRAHGTRAAACGALAARAHSCKAVTTNVKR